MNTYGGNKCVLPSERCQSVKAISYVILTMQHSGRGKTMETKDQCADKELGGMK